MVLQTAAQAVIERCGEALDPVMAMQEVADWAVRRWRESAAEADVKLQMAWAELAVEWQSKVAPYVRPRLTAVAMATASEENAVELIREVRRVIVDPRNT